VFDPAKRRRKGWAALCFFTLIASGWVLTLYLLGELSIVSLDKRPFALIAQGDYLRATPSLLYTLFLAATYNFGVGFAGSLGGFWAFLVIQPLLLVSFCTYACSWLYAKGAPFLLALAFALVFAGLIPLSRAALCPQPEALLVGMLLFLVLWLIRAAGDNCRRLRRVAPTCALYALLTFLVLLNPLMLMTCAVTLIWASLAPSRIKLRLFLLACVVIGLWLFGLGVAAPLLGWSASLLAMLPMAFLGTLSFSSFNIFIFFLATLIVTLAVLARVLYARRPRYLLPFVPLIGFGLTFAFAQPAYAPPEMLSLSAFICCLPYLALIPVMREYTKTKAEMRERFLALRAAIPAEERNTRSDAACSLLVRKLMLLDPRSGYIGLYSAQKSELSLGLLAVQLSVLGYKVAYPALTSNTEMEFFTTLGVSDEDLFNAILEENPFEQMAGADLANLNRVEPSDISALVVPGVVFDQDRQRLGYGGGYYDRYILRLEEDVPVWGVGFREQVTEAVPVERHDLSLTGVVVG
jgi:5-formyltetrahydrofolate cyclo-ligase